MTIFFEPSTLKKMDFDELMSKFMKLEDQLATTQVNDKFSLETRNTLMELLNHYRLEIDYRISIGEKDLDDLEEYYE